MKAIAAPTYGFLSTLALIDAPLPAPGPGEVRVRVVASARPADLRLLATWLADGLEVPLASTIPVRDAAIALARLQQAGGRVAVRVAGGFL